MVTDLRPLTKGDIHLLFYLRDRIKSQNPIKDTNKELAAALEVNTRTIVRCLGKLNNLGHITMFYGPYGANRKIFVSDKQ